MISKIAEKLQPIVKLNRMDGSNYEHIKIPMIYFIMGFLWIYFSDRIASSTITDKNLLLWVSTYKGWLYVFVTSFVLYVLIARFRKRVNLVENQLRKSNEELTNQYNQIKISERNFKDIFEGSSDAILIISGARIADCNSAALTLFGVESKEFILNKKIVDLSPEGQLGGESSEEKATRIYREALENGRSKFEWLHMKSDGSITIVEIMMTSVILNDEKVFHCLCRDINERKNMENKLQHMTVHDQLTGLYNRRFFEEEKIRLDVLEKWPLAVIIADINGLKLINDSFGHEAGDSLIKKVAELISNGAREGDVVCRLAGDEFIIMAPNTDSEEADKIIENIRSSTANTKFGLLDISISFGSEIKRFKEEDIAEVIKNAEDYMCRKKLYEGPSMRSKTISTIAATLHEKNGREELHSRRVSHLCEQMGIALGMNEDKVKELKTVGLLHDIGKIGIDESILNKTGKLTEKEYDEIKKHPEIGYRILSTVNELSEMAEFVLAHHERWDGKGYPKGIAGDEIPIQAGIMAIVDAYDAMISERSYRNPFTREEATRELMANAGTQFNPECVLVFVEKVLKQEEESVSIYL